MSEPHRLRLAVLISGRGSNMAAIARACAQQQINAEIVRVISDRADAEGLRIAQELGLRTCVIDIGLPRDRQREEQQLVLAIDDCQADLVVLAGFMRILSASFVQRYAGRMLNIHPSLLPRHRGLHTHRQALRDGVLEHGASVHYVTPELDAGPVIAQARVPVRVDDDESRLACRVLEQEHRIYPLVIGLIAAGRVQLRGEIVWLDGHALAAPLEHIDVVPTRRQA
jgi:phosphoribosylglycinamide formyltransferase-1